MVQAKRKPIHMEIPADWATMTAEQKHQVALTMAEAMQAHLGITDKSDSKAKKPQTEA